MNLLLLPKELQNSISVFNMEHMSIMRTVMNELLIKCETRKENDKYCSNCCNYSQEQYSNYIFWHKYKFCGEWCRYDTEYQIRKSYKRSL